MDIQLTDFENCALTIAVGMIANIVNTFDLDFILPISLVDENMKRAHNRDGLLQTKFWWKMPAQDEPQMIQVAPLQQTNWTRSNAEGESQQQEQEEEEQKGSSSDDQDRSLNSDEEQQKLQDSDRYKELYIWQILNGDESIGFSKGLIPLCQQYMALKQWPEDKAEEVMNYLRFLGDRSLG